MKSTILAISLMLGMTSFGQSRTASETFKVCYEQQLTSVTGWIKDGNGDWESEKNRVGYYDEFVSMGTFVTYIDDVEYTILKVEQIGGYYEYPTIKSGWTSSNNLSLFVIDKDQLDLLKKVINEPSEKTHQINLKYRSSISDKHHAWGGEYTYSTENLLKSLASKVKGDFNLFDYKLPVSSQIIGNEWIVRFNYPYNYSHYSDIYNTRWGSLDGKYFEVTKNEFNSMFQYSNK